MRLHRLEVQAFGPFGGTEEVDFDALHDAGLFLLSGPTGAGKTSLLDAVCFALYGQVPGVRDERALRSEHAPEGRAPHVELELTVRGRRLRLRRTPEWERPKRRGEGTTVERSSVVFHELRGGEEVLRSTRAQEVGHEIGLLLGMTAAQFQQVALLPQGRFQQFLLADSEERQAVLTRLFGTQRFAAIEEWIADHSRVTTRRAAERRTEVEVRLHSLADRAGRPAPDAAPTPSQTADQWRAWAEEVLAALQAEQTRTTAEADQARARVAELRTRCAEAETWDRWWTRRAQAAARAAAIAAQEDELDHARRRLEAHTAAHALRPLLDDHAATGERVRTALAATGESEATVATALASAEADCETHTSRVAVLDDAMPAVTALADARAEAARVGVELAEVRTELELLNAEAAELPALQEAATRELRAVKEHLAAEPTLTAEVAEAMRIAEAAAHVPELRGALDRAAERVRAAQEADVAALDHLRAVVEARLRGMAGELALALVDGEPCTVCGSTSHPAPARPSADEGSDAAVAAEAHAAAEAARERTTAAVNAARQEHDDAAAALSTARLAAHDRTPEDADAALADAQARLAALDAERVRLPQLQERVAELTRQQESLRTRRDDAAARLEQLRAAAATADARAREHETRVRGLLPPTDSDTTAEAHDMVGALHRARSEAAAALTTAQERVRALRAALEAGAAHRRTTELLAGPLADAGFADVDGARAALLDAHEHARLRAELDRVAAASAEAAAVLREPPPDDLTTPDPGDGDSAAAARQATTSALAAAEEAAHAAERAHATAEERRRAAHTLHERLETALTDWLPVAEQQRHAEGLAKLVRGTSADNRLQMRLSAYVLATRLDQVVDAANVRLARMRDRRFLLRRTDRAASRRTRAGLDLEILDEWTGVARAPSSLSGGETFVVSLTLALGLADVIAQETGGVELETLFVDEGFGMLDADTLDDVLDRLDELRAGGRSVGVVSHVSEMRARIPVQVQVEKTRSGSRVLSPHDLIRSRTSH